MSVTVTSKPKNKSIFFITKLPGFESPEAFFTTGFDYSLSFQRPLSFYHLR